ncbi:hypothetical protein [Pulveribacter sp.]|uniref:hypothetical protein n=1 Tax=Pulveribacter sp. TaxID=2678893 RepID=UPI0028A82CEB|nr:hypothetical protein [Pulveribacter sp.]
MHSFSTVNDAQAAGFVFAAKQKVYVTYRGCLIVGADTSGPRPMGLSFALRVQISEDYTRNYLGVTSDQVFGASVGVRLLNTGGRALGGFAAAGESGGVVQMFEPKTFSEALQDAQGWADRWFRYNPDALERYLLRRAQSRQAAAR